MRQYISSMLLFACVAVTQAQDKDLSYFKKKGAVVNFAQSSHQDIGWMDTPGVCKEFRIEKLIMPSIQTLESNPNYCFTMEYALALEELLEKYPERRDEIVRLTAAKRLDWGATYNQPYESLLGSEALVRQVYLGVKWLKKTLPGSQFLTAFNPDVPGRSLQTSQIYAKAGVKYFLFSRFEPGYYRWFSPDGSSLLCYSNGIYCEYARTLTQVLKTDEERKDYIEKIASSWSDYQSKNKLNRNLFFLFTDDNEEPRDFSSLFGQLSKEKGLAPFKYATVTQAFQDMDNPKSKFERIEGEWPQLWLYIHGPTHHKIVSNLRSSHRKLVDAEKFASLNAVLTGNFGNYPTAKLDEAWRNALYPDHGWGGNNGNTTDSIFAGKMLAADKTARTIVADELNKLSKQIKFAQKGIPIVVFNQLSHERTAPVTINMNRYGSTSNYFRLVDELGQPVATQSVVPEDMKDGQFSFVFVAEKVPSIGYKTYYLSTVNEKPYVRENSERNKFENEYYAIDFVPGGVKSIYDKRIGKELINSTKFLAGEVISLKSAGSGAGEFSEIQPVTTERFEKSSQYGSTWNTIENGPVREVKELKSMFNDACIVQRIVMYKQLPKIDFEFDIDGFTGEPDREYRVTFPLNQDSSQVSYDVPMGVVEIGKNDLSRTAGQAGGLLYNLPLNETPLRECGNWFSASSAGVNVTIASSVSVFGFKDPTGQPAPYTILQPVLLASRRSCHYAGNRYLQTGNHRYTFTLNSTAGNWQSASNLASGDVEQLYAIVAPEANLQAGLKESDSFISSTAPNIIISAVKKCDDDTGLIVRCYDIEGKDTHAVLKLPKMISKGLHTNIIEEPIAPITTKENNATIKVGHHAIETYKFNF